MIGGAEGPGDDPILAELVAELAAHLPQIEAAQGGPPASLPMRS